LAAHQKKSVLPVSCGGEKFPVGAARQQELRLAAAWRAVSEGGASRSRRAGPALDPRSHRAPFLLLGAFWSEKGAAGWVGPARTKSPDTRSAVRKPRDCPPFEFTRTRKGRRRPRPELDTHNFSTDFTVAREKCWLERKAGARDERSIAPGRGLEE